MALRRGWVLSIIGLAALAANAAMDSAARAANDAGRSAAVADGAQRGVLVVPDIRDVPDITASAPRVVVASGALVGVETNGVRVFHGVPYAAPPVGPLRWQPPQPPTPWAGDRAALVAGPNCMQAVDGNGISPGGGRVSEDCLTLQIFAPKAAVKAPVMVWLHYGSNSEGAGSDPVADGSAFARDGIILVAVNYRLGPFGFFAHPALSHAAKRSEPLANYGLMDQIAALRWVAKNIEAFGGDSHNVTLFGASAGGLDTLTLMTAPAARGLFDKAIAESAGGWDFFPTLAAAEIAGAKLAAKVGLGRDATPEQLRAISADRLVSEAAQADCEPVADGRLLTESVGEAFAHGDAARVPLIIGSTSDEASLLEGQTVRLAPISNRMREAYAAIATGERRLALAIFADGGFVAPARWIARQAARHAKTWLYRFSYVRVMKREGSSGAAHVSEVPYVFDSWDRMAGGAAKVVREDRDMTARIHGCWVTFARSGVAACPNGPEWPPYSAERDELMDFGVVTAVRQHVGKVQLDAQERDAAAPFHP